MSWAEIRSTAYITYEICAFLSLFFQHAACSATGLNLLTRLHSLANAARARNRVVPKEQPGLDRAGERFVSEADSQFP